MIEKKALEDKLKNTSFQVKTNICKLKLTD